MNDLTLYAVVWAVMLALALGPTCVVLGVQLRRRSEEVDRLRRTIREMHEQERRK